MISLVRKFAPAKVNLHLKILSKMQNGFHALESIFQVVPLYDEIEVQKVEDRIGCFVKCENMILPEKNTLTDTYEEFCKLTGLKVGVNVKLIKNIPTGAGLGGGSSDAAYFLQALNDMYEYPLNKEEMHEIATRVGSDVSFFLLGGSAIVTGRGEIVNPISMRSDLCFVMVYPDVHVSTAKAYNLVDEYYISGEAEEGPALAELSEMYYNPSSNWKFINSFKVPISKQYPVINEALLDVEMTGASYVQLSGSGSSVFGVFTDVEAAKEAYTKLCQKWKRCYLLPPNLNINDRYVL